MPTLSLSWVGGGGWTQHRTGSVEGRYSEIISSFRKPFPLLSLLEMVSPTTMHQCHNLFLTCLKLTIDNDRICSSPILFHFTVPPSPAPQQQRFAGSWQFHFSGDFVDMDFAFYLLVFISQFCNLVSNLPQFLKKKKKNT